MDVRRFVRLCDQLGSLRTLLLRYSYAFMTMTSQIAACNRAHKVDARMARWLLMTHDRVDGPEFPLTQEFLSQMLGVTRASVNEVAQELQDTGAIDYTRGRMTILDRAQLEARSCECYGVIRDEFDRLLQAGS
jgi:CRP-like cAMP-binding protein